MFGAWLAALIALCLGIYQVLLTLLALPGLSEQTLKGLVLNLIEGVDLFLFGTVFYLIALGLYELFVDDNLPMPAWLVIHDLDDLKAKLLGVIVVVLSVQFLAQVLSWKGGTDILAYGAAVALVIAALAYFIAPKRKKNA